MYVCICYICIIILIIYRKVTEDPSAVIFTELLDLKSSISTVIQEKQTLSLFSDSGLGVSGKHGPIFNPSLLPTTGMKVAIDAEFICVSEEEAEMRNDGRRVVVQEGRLALARVSVLNEEGFTFIDDYIVTSEPVVDYLSRFSGIYAKDLDPSSSPHHLVKHKTAYLKLKCLVDRGCIFIGHGLNKDFRTINLYVPANQIIDTVDIFHRPHQRKISLKFLAAFLLGLSLVFLSLSLSLSLFYTYSLSIYTYYIYIYIFLSQSLNAFSLIHIYIYIIFIIYIGMDIQSETHDSIGSLSLAPSLARFLSPSLTLALSLARFLSPSLLLAPSLARFLPPSLSLFLSLF